MGEALEATSLTAGHIPVDYSDAAAIQAAEVRATGRTNIVPGGLAAAAQSAATRNARITKDEEKTKLGEILSVRSSIPTFISNREMMHFVLITFSIWSYRFLVCIIGPITFIFCHK